MQLAQAEGLLDLRVAPFDAESVWADIAIVHDPAYVEAVRTGIPRSLAESQGFTWSPEFAESVARIWSGHQVACRLARIEKVVLHPVSGAHHAQYGHGGGFCTCNYMVGAGLALLREDLVERVAIIDLDAHQGDGTFALVGDDPRFGLFDIASSCWIGEMTTPRVIYKVAKDALTYMRHLRSLSAFLDAFKPDLVEYQAAMDAWEEDYMGAVEGMNADRLAERDRFVLQAVVSRGIPVVINLGGGYLEDGTTERLHVQTIRAALEVVRAGIHTPDNYQQQSNTRAR